MYFKISWPLFAEETAYLDLLFDMTWCFLQNHVLTPSSHGSNRACCEQLARAPVLLRAVSSISTELEGFRQTKTPQFSESKAAWCHIYRLEKTKAGNWLMQCYQVILAGNSEAGQCSANPHRSGSHRQGHRQVPRGERCTASSHNSKAFTPIYVQCFQRYPTMHKLWPKPLKLKFGHHHCLSAELHQWANWGKCRVFFFHHPDREELE